MMVLKRILSTSVLTATTRHCAKATHGKVASTTTANDRRFRISKGKVSISFTAPVFMLELFSGGRVVINDCVFALLGYEYVIWRGCVFRTNEKQVTHFAQTL